MGRPTVQNLKALKDFQNIFRWDIVLTVPAGLGVDATDFNFRAETMDVPKPTTIDITKENIRGIRVNQPGQIDWSGSITMNVIETTDAKVKQLVKAWREKIYSQADGKAASSREALKGTMTMNMLDNQDVANWRYKIIGVVIGDAQVPPMGSETGHQKITITFHYDTFEESKA